MMAKSETRSLAGLTAAVATVAVFAKLFVPFYLIGSTAIFAEASAVGLRSPPSVGAGFGDIVRRVADLLIVLVLFYGVVIVSYFSHSRSDVPLTYLLGILALHAMFIIFGFAAARALKAVLLVLLGAAAIYPIVLIEHAGRFGDVMNGNYIDDIFGIGERLIYITFHQNIGLTHQPRRTCSNRVSLKSP